MKFIATSKERKYAKIPEAEVVAFSPKNKPTLIYAGTVFEFEGSAYVAKELLWCARDRTQVIVDAEETRRHGQG